VVLGLADGSALVVRHRFGVSYPGDRRTVTPTLEHPFGATPLVVDSMGGALTRIAFRDNDERMLMAAVTDDGRLVLAGFGKESSFLSEEVTLTRQVHDAGQLPIAADYLLLDPTQRNLFVGARSGELLYYDVSDPDAPQLIERLRLVAEGTSVSSLRFLLGGYSLLVGGSDGSVTQWFPVRDEANRYRLTRVRGFDAQRSPVSVLASEERRKGFAAGDQTGRVGIYHATAHRSLLTVPVSDRPIGHLLVSPRGDRLLAEDADGRLHLWALHNEHPEVSWSSLWRKVHYEGYAEPSYLWQSSSASNDFEPKFSLMPLAFGTLKAAFYAMLIAVPLAILGAIYTAYFMSPGMRGVVKPTIEIMEALPTVILGFLAGLWLAPTVETYLPGVFLTLVMLPVGMLLFAWFWHLLPGTLRHRVPDGWEAVLLVPVVIALVWLAFTLSLPLEHWLFDGDIRAWLGSEGLDYDQRNALVVGAAMGFAVIPTIFSIAEDAIFSVPKHLTFGSLALGATPWQTLVRVVILTASPGIFSAVMIGLGRAVGETMIVLMATGNTPVMDLSIFQGMRTLSANVAVEMPESEVASTHYRVLFLAALVLFMFTFVFNTAAEIVRHRLRRKYSSL
jgi:phosphate transport system permease protein